VTFCFVFVNLLFVISQMNKRYTHARAHTHLDILSLVLFTQKRTKDREK